LGAEAYSKSGNVGGPGAAITLAQAYAAGAAATDSTLTLDATRGGITLDATAFTGAVISVVVSAVSKFSVSEAGNLRTAGTTRLDGLGSTGLVKNTNGGTLSIATSADYVVPAGATGGQTIYGGVAASENLILGSTFHATKGKVYLGAALTIWADGVDGNARLNVDTTGLTTTVPVLVKNGKSLSGIELQVTGTVATGYLLRDAAGALQSAYGLAVSINDWVTGSAANETVVQVAAAKRFLVGNAGGRHIFGVLPTTGGEIRVYDSASTANYFSITANFGGSGAIPAGTLLAPTGATSSLTLLPDATSAANKIVLAYRNIAGGSWLSALEIANSATGPGNLLLMSGGGAVCGSAAAAGTFTLSSTSHATKGFVYFGSSTGLAYDETNKNLALGVAPTAVAKLQTLSDGAIPSFQADCNAAAGNAAFVARVTITPRSIALKMYGDSATGTTFGAANGGNASLVGTNTGHLVIGLDAASGAGSAIIFGTNGTERARILGSGELILATSLAGGTTASANLSLSSTTHATKGKINFGGASALTYYDETLNKFVGGSSSILLNTGTGLVLAYAGGSSISIGNAMSAGPVGGFTISEQSSAAGGGLILLRNTFNASSGAGRAFTAGAIFAPSSGTSTFNFFDLSYTINQTGGANGLTTGISMVVTETAVVGAHNLIDLRIGATSKFKVDNAGKPLFGLAAIALGGGAAPTVGTIGGSGPATAAQNSWGKINFAGTDYFLQLWT
jgi:hypothetical protein